MENNQCYTMLEVTDILKISKSSIENHLYQLAYVNYFDVWFPHKLSGKNLLDHISAYDSLLKHNKDVSFFKTNCDCNEKWILYSNVEQKILRGKWNEPPPATPKAGLHPEKVMLCTWWDWKGVLCYELLLDNQMLNSNKYCSQLDQLKAALNKSIWN